MSKREDIEVEAAKTEASSGMEETAQKLEENTAGDSQAQQEIGDLSPEQLKEQLTKQTALADEYFARLQRLQADFENFRRRTKQEREDLLRYGAANLVTALLPVIDNLERALAAKGDEGGLHKGVEMTIQQFISALESQGVKQINAVGDQFDPNLHQAVMRMPSSEHPDNQVVEEFQKGYLLQDRVIRPAMVKVAVAE